MPQLLDLHVEEVSAVDHPANKRTWLVVKRGEGTPTAGMHPVQPARDALQAFEATLQ